ncbi:MAG: alanine racemase, partial [Bacteroidales bacterium]
MALNYSIRELAAMCSASVMGNHDTKTIVSHIFTDSRSYAPPVGSLFVAIEGERHDGHRYIPGLIQRGFRCFLVSDTTFTGSAHPDATFLVVGNTLEALRSIALNHRAHYDIPVAGITGSNGKTIVKEWLAQLLAPEYRICRSPLSYNSQIGVPLSVLQINADHQLGIFEAGISQPGEMEKLEPVIIPTFGVFTGIGAAHDENFTGRRQKTEEKLKLFRNTGNLICSSDDEESLSILTIFAAKHNIQLFTTGTDPESTLQIINTVHTENLTTITAGFHGEIFSFSIPFLDDASEKNSLLCVATLLFLGYQPEQISSRMLHLEPVAMRMEQVEGINNCILINDSYNNDLLALSMALDHLRHNNARPGKFLILSDILQTGMQRDQILEHLSTLINSYSLTGFVGIGSTMARLDGRLNCNAWFYEDTEHFLRYHPMSVFLNHVILLKGARPFRFERIRDALQRKTHGTVLEINLNALVHNLNFFRSRLERDTRIMAMIKASSYGSGSFEIASVLQHQQVDYLAVAYCDEGVELRKAGITIPIMVMNPEPASFELMISLQLEPAIYSFSLLNDFTKALTRSHPYACPIHIEVDSGMHRLGFNPDEIPELIHTLSGNALIAVKTVFSHLATADNRTDTTFAKAQIDLFSRIKEKFTEGIHPTPWFHILNSAGILN